MLFASIIYLMSLLLTSLPDCLSDPFLLSSQKSFMLYQWERLGHCLQTTPKPQWFKSTLLSFSLMDHGSAGYSVLWYHHYSVAQAGHSVTEQWPLKSCHWK